MIDLSVKIEKPRASRSGRKFTFGSRVMSPIVARALASEIKRRTILRGDTVESFRGYKAKGRRHVHVDYAKNADMPIPSVSERGIVTFKTPVEMHSQMKRGSFFVSGGMWSGLSVVPLGRQAAVIKFRGRSLGQDLFQFRSQKKSETAADFKTARAMSRRKKHDRLRGGTIRPIKVSNALKAFTVWRASGVHLLLIKHDERLQVAHAIADHIGARVHDALGGDRKDVKFSGVSGAVARDLKKLLLGGSLPPGVR